MDRGAEQQEIARSKKPGEALSWDDLGRMRYTWAAAMDTLRMGPPTAPARTAGPMKFRPEFRPKFSKNFGDFGQNLVRFKRACLTGRNEISSEFCELRSFRTWAKSFAKRNRKP